MNNYRLPHTCAIRRHATQARASQGPAMADAPYWWSGDCRATSLRLVFSPNCSDSSSRVPAKHTEVLKDIDHFYVLRFFFFFGHILLCVLRKHLTSSIIYSGIWNGSFFFPSDFVLTVVNGWIYCSFWKTQKKYKAIIRVNTPGASGTNSKSLGFCY